MDSLKLDRFRKLLNRQNTTLSVGDTSSSAATNSLPANVSSTTPGTSAGGGPDETATASSTKPNVDNLTSSAAIAISFNLPHYVTKDNPKPAVFIARKLLSDFMELANNKIEIILAQEPSSRDKPIFSPLHRGRDDIYDQVLDGLGVISEYCLPSLLELLLAWYHYQLDIEENLNSSINASCQKNLPTATIADGSNCNQQQETTSFVEQSAEQNLPDCCGSPSCQTDGSQYLNQSNLNQLIRSPLPSSPDVSLQNNGHQQQQISIASSLPLDYQSPSSLTTINISATNTNNNNNNNINATFNQGDTSTANTSNSTATNASSNSITLDDSTNTIKRTELIKTRKLLIEYTFCQALIEIFSKLNLHPGHEDLIYQIEEIAFEHFKHIDHSQQPNQLPYGLELSDINKLADKYAQVIGLLAQTRFNFVRKRFTLELNELKSKEYTPYNIQCIVSLLSGLKFFRVKMAPIEEFEASFQLLQELADYFVEVRHKSIRHTLAELFIEILLPLATIVKNEVKIPCLKNFVDTLWAPTLDMCTRKKHSSTLFPLVTCLLCVSQRTIFLQNWIPFLNMCQSNLKNRDQKMCKIALESLYRLIWMYMMRVKCESNNVTQARLSSLVDSLFPKGSRQVVPRDAALDIYVDIIQFIAQERLDFAMRHIIFELLSVDRSFKVIMAPERMNIGLKAFLVIADGLQQKDGGDLTMPLIIGTGSGQIGTMNGNYHNLIGGHQYCTDSSHHQHHHHSHSVHHNATIGSRRHNTSGHHHHHHHHHLHHHSQLNHHHNHRMLYYETAKSIGLHPYYNHIMKTFNEILKALDGQFGRPLMLTCYPNTHKDLDELISGDRRPKIELLRTCIAAIPRLIPDGMSKADLIDLLSRMTLHVDEVIRRLAFEALQILVIEYQDWRLDAIEGYTLFLAKQIDESLKHLVDSALKMLLQLLISWRTLITSSTSSSLSNLTTSSSVGGNTASAGIGYNNYNGSNTNNSTTRTSFVTIQTGYETISSLRSFGVGCGLSASGLLSGSLVSGGLGSGVCGGGGVGGGGGGGAGGQIAARKNRALAEMRLIQSELSNTRFDRLVNVIQKVEGASLVMLCNCHHQTRKLASCLLRECRSILKCYSSWTCMEQFGFKTPTAMAANSAAALATTDDIGAGINCGASSFQVDIGTPYNLDGDDLSVSMKGSLSADNLSRITTTSCALGAGGCTNPAHSSATSVNNNNNFNTTGANQSLLTTSVSKMFISGTPSASQNQQQQQQQQQQQHDLYDEDIENNLTDCYSNDDNSTVIFWLAIMMLESDKEHEYTFGLRLLRKILPNMPFEQQDFIDELDRNLSLMQWQDSFPGLHSLILKGCSSASTYELCISLLDHLTPILKHKICTGNPSAIQNKQTSSNNNNNQSSTSQKRLIPKHVLMLATYLLSTYEDPNGFSLNIARRLALCCQEESESAKLENLAAVMTLYSRRSFSKDAFQWIKCIAKYLNDACAPIVPQTIPLLVELLERGPSYIQPLILPMIYCLLTYIDINRYQQESAGSELESTPNGAAQCLAGENRAQTASNQPKGFNGDLLRIYNKCLGASEQQHQQNCSSVHLHHPVNHFWRDSMQIFKLVISKSSSLTVASTRIKTTSNGTSSATTSAGAPAAPIEIANTNSSAASYPSGLTTTTPSNTETPMSTLPSLFGGTVASNLSGSTLSGLSTTTTHTTTTTTGFASLTTSVSASSRGCVELPGRTLEFSLDIESTPVIGRSRLIELGVISGCASSGTGGSGGGGGSSGGVCAGGIGTNLNVVVGNLCGSQSVC